MNEDAYFKSSQLKSDPISRHFALSSSNCGFANDQVMLFGSQNRLKRMLDQLHIISTKYAGRWEKCDCGQSKCRHGGGCLWYHYL